MNIQKRWELLFGFDSSGCNKIPTPINPIPIPTQLQIEVFAPSIALKIAIQNGRAEIKSATMPEGTSLNCAKVTIPKPSPSKSAPSKARARI